MRHLLNQHCGGGEAPDSRVRAKALLCAKALEWAADADIAHPSCKFHMRASTPPSVYFINMQTPHKHGALVLVAAALGLVRLLEATALCLDPLVLADALGLVQLIPGQIVTKAHSGKIDDAYQW